MHASLTSYRKAKNINKSILWYQMKMLKEGKAIMVYDEVKVKME